MSYPGVDLADVQEQTNPDGTQEPSASGTQNPLIVSKDEVKQAVSEMFKVTDAWAPRQTQVKFKIECPSGQTALAKHLDTMDLLEAGLIEELDYFTRRLFPRSIDPSGNPIEAKNEENETLWQALRDPQKRRRFFDMTGRLMAVAAVRPRVVFDGVYLTDDDDPAERKVIFGFQLSEDERKKREVVIPTLKKNETYAGAIDFADRMAFFHELNRPLRQIEPFRPESAVVLQNMAGSEGDGDKTE